MKQEFWLAVCDAQETDHLPVKIVETQSFRKDALRVLSEEDLIELKMEIATTPQAGVVVPQTNGVRKLRYPIKSKGKGKRAGARIIYYYHCDNFPIFLLAFYAKGEKADMTTAEKQKIKKFICEIVAEYKRTELRLVV